MKSNLDKMKQLDSLDPGLEVFLLRFQSLGAEQGLIVDPNHGFKNRRKQQTSKFGQVRFIF
jgi:hypothetical protein